MVSTVRVLSRWCPPKIASRSGRAFLSAQAEQCFSSSFILREEREAARPLSSVTPGLPPSWLAAHPCFGFQTPGILCWMGFAQEAGNSCHGNNALLLTQWHNRLQTCGSTGSSPSPTKGEKSLLSFKAPSADQMIPTHFRGFV